ncbi:tetratricopeptide repeat protein [Yeosuana marina]|uniref:tetratricopeptide repeat protein n=1 Tax=Yeosuana marina TaxID=1565536 RepID=UPI00142196C5|nr:tetratricopeptide repeat protein [Yeosuana marina]
MKIKQIGIVLVMVFMGTQLVAQSTIQDIVKEGVQYHDNGEYEKAIEIYKKALKINPKSPLVNYELSFSYIKEGDYKQAINHSDIVINQNAEYMIPAYITKGSALDMLGKTKESIKLFEKAIKKTNGHFLLYYNLALNYYKLNDLDKAEENVIKAIEQNPNHSSSHLMLANINNQKKNTVQTLLATHYFLFLEPDSERSLGAYQMLQENFGGNVSKDENKPNTINITLTTNKDNDFGAAELMISLLEASKTLEENEGKTEDEMFIKNTDSFFTMLGELKKKKNKGIWWVFYTTFFYDLAKSEHMEAYCKYISQSGNENSRKWLDGNETKLSDFGNWLKRY